MIIILIISMEEVHTILILDSINSRNFFFVHIQQHEVSFLYIYCANSSC